MSRSYRFMLEVRNVSPTEHPRIHNIASNWMTSIKDFYTTEDYFGIWGESHLGGGMSEEEAHNRIKEQIEQVNPNSKVVTHWQMLEEYDYVFGEES